MNQKVEKALNDQMKYELESAYIYLGMSIFLNTKDLEGAAHWMNMQVLEESIHAAKIHAFMTDREGKILLHNIEAPPVKWESVLATFEAALAHEQKMTERLNSLMDLSLAERDHATVNLMQWFINEQVEEEATLNKIIPKIRLAGSEGSAILLIDQELATRIQPPLAIPPTQNNAAGAAP